MNSMLIGEIAAAELLAVQRQSFVCFAPFVSYIGNRNRARERDLPGSFIAIFIAKKVCF